MNDEGGNVPGHGKHSHRAAQQQHTCKVDMALVFRSKKKGCCAKMLRKMTSNNKHQQQPEKQQKLVLTKV